MLLAFSLLTFVLRIPYRNPMQQTAGSLYPSKFCSIPPPTYSDGVAVNKKVESGWAKANGDWISIYFKQYVPMLTPLYPKLVYTS